MSPFKQQHIPLYKRVEQHLVADIDEGRLVPGDLIPSEPQLAALLDVSQGTVKKAIDNLVKEKRLFRHQGKGTYVSTINFNNSLFRFFSYGDGSGQGARIRKEASYRALQVAPDDVCHALGYDKGSELLYIQRCGYTQGQPVLVEHCWWCPDVVPGMESDSVHIPDLMYALVVEKFGVPVTRADETLTAEAADEETAAILEIKANVPVIVLTRNTYSRNNKMIEYRRTIGRADRFSYKAEIR